MLGSFQFLNELLNEAPFQLNSRLVNHPRKLPLLSPLMQQICNQFNYRKRQVAGRGTNWREIKKWRKNLLLLLCRARAYWIDRSMEQWVGARVGRQVVAAERLLSMAKARNLSAICCSQRAAQPTN